MLIDSFYYSPSFIYSVLGLGIGLVLAYCIHAEWKNVKKRKHLTEMREQKQKERQGYLQQLKERYPLTPGREKILKLNLEALCTKLHSHELKARQVLEAFFAKAVAVTWEYNCVTEFISQSFAWADQLDAHPHTMGPLHGVPFCVSDDIDIEGLDTTLGLSVNLYKPKLETAVVVRVLQQAGAIPFCKTNMSQTTLPGSSGNPIFGTTVNPLNKALSPGGSSSGNGCLIKGAGVFFGLGTDLGGSLRIPAHMCGVASLRPTNHRNSDVGVARVLQDIAGYSNVPGVMAKNVKTLSRICKYMWRNTPQTELDSCTAPVAWNHDLFTSKEPLRIGYFTSISTFPAIGDTAGTVLWAKHALEEMGHTVVQFEMLEPEKLEKLYSTLLVAGRGTQLYDLLKHDVVCKETERFSKVCYASSCPSFLHTTNGMAVDSDAQKSEVLWQYLKEQRMERLKMLRRLKELELDLIISPVLPFPAPKLEDVDQLIRASYIYTAIWNLLDFPAGVIPFGQESGSKVEEVKLETKSHLEKMAKENLKLAKGMPIGLQVIGKPFKEEMVLRVMQQLEDFLSVLKDTGHHCGDEKHEFLHPEQKKQEQEQEQK